MPRISRRALAVSGAYLATLAVIGLWPSRMDKNVDVRDSVLVRAMTDHLGLHPENAYRVVEITANITLFAPLGLMVLAIFPRLRWGWAVLVGFVLSSAVELVQVVARPERVASVSDVVSNTLGAAVGALLITTWRSRHRDRNPAGFRRG